MKVRLLWDLGLDAVSGFGCRLLLSGDGLRLAFQLIHEESILQAKILKEMHQENSPVVCDLLLLGGGGLGRIPRLLARIRKGSRSSEFHKAP